MCGLPDNAKTPRPGGFTAWPGCCFARKILLLVFVDLDIARGAFILPEQQNGGQGDSQCGEDGEQSFENFHGLVPPCEVRERSGGRSACHVRYSIAYSHSKGKRQKRENKKKIRWLVKTNRQKRIRKFRKIHHLSRDVVDFPRQNDTISVLSSCCPCTSAPAWAWGWQFKQNGGFEIHVEQAETCGAWRAYAA